MYRPSMYNKHDETMNKFSEMFNSCQEYQNLIMNPIDKETFIDDGEIIDTKTGKKFCFDWEYRDKYFSHGIFCFDTLGQYERKIIKPSIELSIQCDSTFTAIAVAWHNDFKKENQVLLNLSTDYYKEQLGKVRYTHSFKIYKFEDLVLFKQMIQRSFDNNDFSSNIF